MPALAKGLSPVGRKALSEFVRIIPPAIASSIAVLAKSGSTLAILTAIRNFSELAYFTHLLKSPLYIMSYSPIGGVSVAVAT